MMRFTGVVLAGLVLSACGDDLAPGGGGGAQNEGGAGGAPGCEPQPPPADGLVKVPEASFPGPVVMSRESAGGDIGLVSLDADGTVRWITYGYDFFAFGTDVWQPDAGGVAVAAGARGLGWPDSPAIDLASVDLSRIDDRQIAARLTAESGDSDQVWLAGGLCADGCGDGPAYPCELDFDASWELVQSDR